jgi:Ca-activated chloride channel homolog
VAAPADTTKPRWPYTGTAQSAAAPTALDPASAFRRNYYVVFDASGSMMETRCSDPENKITVAKRALVEFAAKLPPDANFGLSVFDSAGIRELLPIGPIVGDAVVRAIAPIRASGSTPLVGAMRRAAAALTEQGRRQSGYGEFHLVVVTDGESTDGNPKVVVDEVLAASPIVLHTVGFCIGTSHSLNQPGKVVYRPADNPEALARGLADVLAESPAFAAGTFR